MFANGLLYLTWVGIEKKYVPGIMTAPVFIVAILTYYFTILF